MSSVTAYVTSASGESGELANVTRACEKSTQSLTALCDALSSPSVTDSFDASCNTCRHFSRRPMTPAEKQERNVFGMPGSCNLKGIDVRGWQRGQFCGFENAFCYENRRTGMRPVDAYPLGSPSSFTSEVAS